MIEMLEKLINEHGSSQILRERLELFSDKYSMLEEKLSQSEKRNSELEELVAHLRAELGFKISELNDLLAAPEPDPEKLPPEQEKILQMIFRENRDLSPEELAGQLQLEPGVIEYHIDSLSEKDLLAPPNITMGNSFTGDSGSLSYPLSSQGRKYVVEVIGV